MFNTQAIISHALNWQPTLIGQESVVPQGLNLENFLIYTPLQHDLISHFLTLGVGTMAVGFVYFITTMRRSAPKYQPSSVLSAIVMVSAFLILFRQLQGWEAAFRFDGQVYRLADSTFSNGFRYLNWSIDVPCLLTQMLVVINVTPARFRNTRNRFIAAGLLMIYTGYIGQFFQMTSIPWFMLWGAISTVFYIYILYTVGNLVFRSREGMPRQAYNIMGRIWWLLLISWTLYPLAYLVPLGFQLFPDWGAWAAVTRQFLYTMADIFSKVIYGVLLTRVAQILSVEAGYKPALDVIPGSNGNGNTVSVHPQEHQAEPYR
ncbi:bacteriorhodopsin [Sphaerothrix gracilis]|uniref:bacteriorhodopsin n=1 Tax=Sphaerothrix gracilis TaxID=3151835 RepID=UPI0031FE0A4E